MLTETDPDAIAAFRARKRAQWDRIAGTLPGLGMVQAGEQRTQFALVYAGHGREEQVIYGQLPHTVIEHQGTGPFRRRAAVPDARKPIEKRAIDLSDDEIDAVLAAWRNGAAARGNA